LTNLDKRVIYAKTQLAIDTVNIYSKRNMEILNRISHTSFLQSNNSLCLLVSEENFFLNFSQAETSIAHSDHAFVQSGRNEGNV
jgi:hypothetical protein